MISTTLQKCFVFLKSGGYGTPAHLFRRPWTGIAMKRTRLPIREQEEEEAEEPRMNMKGVDRREGPGGVASGYADSVAGYTRYSAGYIEIFRLHNQRKENSRSARIDFLHIALAGCKSTITGQSDSKF